MLYNVKFLSRKCLLVDEYEQLIHKFYFHGLYKCIKCSRLI